jgi:hypothetical protein
MYQVKFMIQFFNIVLVAMELKDIEIILVVPDYFMYMRGTEIKIREAGRYFNGLSQCSPVQ